ncbi:MAG: carbonic anhydrase family protein [Bdellovibrionales bacterium]|nr:carbonic anhydrase family protein [Bdellovibrionales bacterium]
MRGTNSYRQLGAIFFATSLLVAVASCASKTKSPGLPPEKQITQQAPAPVEEPPKESPPAAPAETDASHSDPNMVDLPASGASTEDHPPADHPPAAHHPRWSYEGVFGPAMWGDLDAEYASCKTGDMQSPVDLKWSKPAQGRKLDFKLQPSRLRLVDNGHTIQANIDSGSQLSIGGEVYDLVQIHFHSPSEHTLSGKQFPMELHMVHKSPSGKLAVVGRMMKVGAKENPLIGKLWANLPKDKSSEVEVAGTTLEVAEFLPKSLTYYNYAGSLTTPPCTQGVDWNVLNTPLEISKAQLEAFKAIYPNNSRPVQALNGRKPINF